MTNTLATAFEALSRFPEPVQEQIGRDLLDYAEKLARLRAEVAKGEAEIEAGMGLELTPELQREWKERVRQRARDV